MRRSLGLRHPTEFPLETVAYARGILVRDSVATGARATLVRVGSRAIIAVGGGLLETQRRFAIAHEFGHRELHTKVSYLGLCTGDALTEPYGSSGREEEASAFAAEFLLPADFVKPRCDVSKVRWQAIKAIAEEFVVSLTAAAMRFVDHCPERVALVCSRAGKVAWLRKNEFFGRWIEVGQPLSKWTLASDYFTKGRVTGDAESVNANAWIANLPDDAMIDEHCVVQPSLRSVMSLLWIKPDAEY